MNKEIDLVSLPKKSFWKLSLPIIAFCIFDAIYGIVDMLWVSQISIEAFFAMGVSIPFVSLIFSFGDSIGQGTNSMMSRFIGSGDYESSYNALIHGMILSNAVWIVIVLCVLFAEGILFFVNEYDQYLLIFDYLVPIVVFAYIFIFNNLFSETFQAEGDSKIPTVLMIGSNILNIILDPIFIFYFNLGIKGAAYATVLSALIVFSVFFYMYISGKTKVPLSIRYFKFRPYILIEIFKVALPNFLDNGLWTFSASFINSILIMTMGDIGPILYSVSNKLKTLLQSPVRGYGRGLMSVTGHLFGARKFDELNAMFKYVLKVSLITTAIVMIVFIFISSYTFSLFSITGMDSEVFWIAIGGTIIMMSLPFSMISSKMLDGFGKSMYSLLFTALKIIFEAVLIYAFSIMLNNASCVLIGIIISEIVFAIVYYLFMKYLFKNFDKKYENKETVKTFEFKSNEDGRIRKNMKKNKNKAPLIIAFIFMGIILFNILMIPITMNDYSLFMEVIVALLLGAISIYLLTRLKKPIVSIIGFLMSVVILFIFMGSYGYLATLLYIIAGILIMYMIKIAGRLTKDEE